MLVLDVNNTEKGQLYSLKSHLPNGLFLNIKHSVCNKLSLTTKHISFTHLSFNRLGDRFLACDLHGSIYMFDLNYNRYMRLNRMGITCTAIAYNLKCKTEYLVACIDGTVKCFNTETRDLVGWMKGHEKPILSLSVHPTQGDAVISFSADLAQLWDLKTFECKQKLSINAKRNVELVKIAFAPTTCDIVAMFKDDSIYVWSSSSSSPSAALAAGGDEQQQQQVALKCQFNVAATESNATTTTTTTPASKHAYKCFSISGDGKLMVAVSRNNYLHVFSIETKELLKTIELKEAIKDCVMLPGACYDNKLLVVLTQSAGSLDVYNLDATERQQLLVATLSNQHIVHNQSQMLNEQKIAHLVCSPNARYLCAMTESGCILCYDLDLSPIKQLKATCHLMKSSINSTTTNVKSHARTHEDVTKKKDATKKNAKSNSSTMIERSNRTQNMLDNAPQISDKLLKILKCYNEYPGRYRLFIWKMLLKLPENYEAYASFVERGTHPAFANLATKYPLKSQKCVRLLERTLSSLAHWAPIMAECDYIPLLIFPFVKLFQNNQVVCFEIVATLIHNWCQHWFEFFPNPPMNILNMIENLLAHHDKNLLEHFMRYRITSQMYGWSLLETIFSEVFSKSEWQILVDNIFSSHPGFLLYLVAAYSICNRSALVQVKEIDDVKYFFHHRNPLSVGHLLAEARKMHKLTPSGIDPCKLLSSFEPLTKGSYPVFNKRPKFISDYQAIEKNKILAQEVNYLKERDAHLESHKLIESRKLENEYLLKELWDRQHNTSKLYKQSVDEYEKRQTGLERIRVARQHSEFTANISCPRADQSVSINVAGEPLVSTDRRGKKLLNKMKMIDENYADIETMLRETRNLNDMQDKQKKKTLDFRLEADYELNDDDFREIESEIVANRNNELASTATAAATVCNTNTATKPIDQYDNINKQMCLNDQSDSIVSSAFSLERGREGIEKQQREAMQRVYELRKTIAMANRNKGSNFVKSII